MKFKYILSLSLACCLLASCERFLDVEPKGIVIPTHIEDYERLLNAETITNSFPEHLFYASDDVHFSHSNTAQDPIANAYFWKTTIDVDNDAPPAIWGSLYRQIYNNNIIVNKVMDAVGGTEVTKQQLLGEALTNRATAYFTLVTAFTKAYDPATAASLPGIPWVDYTDVTNETPGRSTLEATMDLIIKDLKDAEGLLTDSRLNRTRVNMGVTQAMLSRVYLYMGNYPEAGRYAALALDAPHEFRDYNDYSTVYEFPEPENDPEILWLRAATDYTIIFFPNLSADLINRFEPDDLRLTFHAMDYYGEGWYYFVTKKWGNFGINFMELKLTLAEALAHQDDLDGAMVLVNEIRELRIANDGYVPLSSTDKETVIQYVLEERRKELAIGSCRWMDMKRLAKQGRGTVATRQTADRTDILSIDPATFEFTFEIPSRVLMFNPGMPTNF